MTKHRRSHPEYQAYMKKYAKRYRANNPERIKALDAKKLERQSHRTLTDPEFRRKRQLQSKARNLRIKFGITLADFQSLLVAQNNRCGICERPLDTVTAMVDHDHKTGEVRGVLCNGCNAGIGFFNEKIESLISAGEYLRRGGSAAKTRIISQELASK